MTISQPKATEYQVENIKVQQFFDKKFIKALNGQFDNIQVQHFCLYTLDSDKNILGKLAISHETPSDCFNDTIKISANNPKSMDKLMNAVIKFLDE